MAAVSLQGGRRGHDSVEDARAALDLYKLVEEEWEREVEAGLGGGEPGHDSSHYMQDQYWPSHLANSQ